MLYSIPTTRMLKASRASLAFEKRPKGITFEILIFLVISTICSFIQNTVLGTLLSIYAFCDPEYIKIVESAYDKGQANVEELMTFFNEFNERFNANTPPLFYIVLIASSGIMVVASLIYCIAFQKRNSTSMGLAIRPLLPEYAIGLLLGCVMISLPALACHITGCVGFDLVKSPGVLNIVFFFLAFILQGLGEEVFFRGYLLPSIARKTHVWVAIILTSLLFAIFHSGNTGFSIIAFINLTLFGIFASVLTLKRGSIWMTAAIHTAWNFVQGNVFGFSVSGNSGLDSVLNSKLQNVGTILSGGKFGLEGGLGVTVVLLIALLCVLVIPAKKSELCEEPEKEGKKDNSSNSPSTNNG